MKKHAILFIFCFSMVLAIMPAGIFASVPGPENFKKVNTYVPGQFEDVLASDWFAPNVADAYEFGLMIGAGDAFFNAYGDVTIAEAITMAARIHSIYTRGSDRFEKAALWYRPYLDYAVWNGVIAGEYTDYGKTATRAEFAEILAGALPAEALGEINTVVDGAVPDVDPKAGYAPEVYKLYRAGILAGNDAYGTFTPGSNIARAAAAAIVTRMADASLRVKITLAEAVQVLYAADGRTRITLRSEVEAYLKVGWYIEPVIIMYAPDGRTRYTLLSEINEYLKVGWYKEPVNQEYNTGITYDQIARTPDTYKGKKVRFSGFVLQVMESENQVELRIATDGNYDDIIYVYYKSSLVSSRILEDDYITIYGVSEGLYTYISAWGVEVTIPLISVDKILR